MCDSPSSPAPQATKNRSTVEGGGATRSRQGSLQYPRVQHLSLYFHSPELQALLRTCVKLGEGFQDEAPVQQWGALLADLVEHEVAEELQQVTVTCTTPGHVHRVSCIVPPVTIDSGLGREALGAD